jgi:hypothetical protein
MGIRSTVETAVGKGLRPCRPHDDDAVVTWRYLRLALVLLVIGLGTSIVYERVKVDADCWLTSISAYYYTPVQGFLVGALITIGVCLVCLRGASDGEDNVLNLAGFCAPFVALVPIPETTGTCGSKLVDTAARNDNIGNNVFALLVISWLALAILATLAVRRGKTDPAKAPKPVDRWGFGIALAALAVATALFAWGRPTFTAAAHYVAAGSLFLFVFVNVCLNAVQRYLARREQGGSPRRFNRYAMIATLMLTDALVHAILWWREWPWWALTGEASLIALFAIFWSVQTAERWTDGISPLPAPAPASTSLAPQVVAPTSQAGLLDG